jgi:hypothetical protein
MLGTHKEGKGGRKRKRKEERRNEGPNESALLPISSSNFGLSAIYKRILFVKHPVKLVPSQYGGGFFLPRATMCELLNSDIPI